MVRSNYFKTVIVFIGVVICDAPVYADTFVEGYFRSNGTYVAPHFRSDPNWTKIDNYSTKGNRNPYTGEAGTKNVDGHEDLYRTTEEIKAGFAYQEALINKYNSEAALNKQRLDNRVIGQLQFISGQTGLSIPQVKQVMEAYQNGGWLAEEKYSTEGKIQHITRPPEWFSKDVEMLFRHANSIVGANKMATGNGNLEQLSKARQLKDLETEKRLALNEITRITAHWKKTNSNYDVLEPLLLERSKDIAASLPPENWVSALEIMFVAASEALMIGQKQKTVITLTPVDGNPFN